MRHTIRLSTALAVILGQLLPWGCAARPRGDPAIAPPGAPESLHYVVVRGGATVAHVSTRTDDSGVTIVRSGSHPDTGRVIATQLRFDPRSGIPVWLQTNGVDGRGRPVEEHFEITDGVASWLSAPESGQKHTDSDAIYLPAANASWEAILPGVLNAAPVPLHFFPAAVPG